MVTKTMALFILVSEVETSMKRAMVFVTMALFWHTHLALER